VKFQNRKPNPSKTQIVVSCVKNGLVEKTEKLQNKNITYSLKRANRPVNGQQKVHLKMYSFRHVNGGPST